MGRLLTQVLLSSLVVKDLRLKDKEKDLMSKDEDKDEESSFKDKDKVKDVQG